MCCVEAQNNFVNVLLDSSIFLVFISFNSIANDIGRVAHGETSEHSGWPQKSKMVMWLTSEVKDGNVFDLKSQKYKLELI